MQMCEKCWPVLDAQKRRRQWEQQQYQNQLYCQQQLQQQQQIQVPEPEFSAPEAAAGETLVPQPTAQETVAPEPATQETMMLQSANRENVVQEAAAPQEFAPVSSGFEPVVAEPFASAETYDRTEAEELEAVILAPRAPALEPKAEVQNATVAIGKHLPASPRILKRQSTTATITSIDEGFETDAPISSAAISTPNELQTEITARAASVPYEVDENFDSQTESDLMSSFSLCRQNSEGSSMSLSNDLLIP